MEPFIGEIKIVPYDFAPKGWAFCDGATLQISQHAPLFSLVGTAYGGDGAQTFRLPDLRGRVALSADRAAFRIGVTGGEETHELVLAEMPVPHNHGAQGTQTAGTSYQPGGNVLAAPGLNAYAAPSPPQPLATGTIAVSGGTPHANMAPYLVLNFCIALVGLYPPKP
jgi:microcystin-dependent protein